MGDEFDLFGDPVRDASGRRGRPAHRPSQENRNKVIMLLAMGWSNERIASALHISQPTLRRYYFSELKSRLIQRDRLDAHRMWVVTKAANEGNVGAMRLQDQMLKRNDDAVIEARMREQGRDKTTPKPGKKQLDEARAVSAEERLAKEIAEEANNARQH